MSELQTLIDERHVRYIEAHSLAEDPFLKDLKREAATAGIPAIWISPAQAGFMQILLRIGKAREVVEVGTLAGYSAIAMARALPADGHVRTIELEPKHADFAERWIARSNVAGQVEVLRGSGLEVLPRMATDSADAAFLDADKGSYPKYLAECLRIVRSGGLILADNAFAFGELFDEKASDKEVPAIRHFNDVMARETRLESIIVPFGDGLWVGVKR
jgi:predicted O-methyltransferase YrrM